MDGVLCLRLRNKKRRSSERLFGQTEGELPHVEAISRLPPLDSGPANVILDVTTTIERQTGQKAINPQPKSNNSQKAARNRRLNNNKRTLKEKDLALAEEVRALG